MAFDDQAVVKEQYATEANLRARQALWIGAEGEDAKEILWQQIVLAKPRRLLEVGGGQGELAERIQRDLGAQVSFLDFSPRMVELAQVRGVVDARQGDVQALPFEEGSFDTAVAAWMLYHVPDLDRGLSELARVLDDDGSLIAVTNSEHHIAELRELFAYPRDAFTMSFNSENGEDFLRRHFASVERFDCEVRATVRDRGTLVAYGDSSSFPTREVPADVPLPFLVHGRSTIFVATK
ncbi:MAG: class I SAM-dependent methyltransferase [Actinobacteria bacterium]|nr:class I SAM-dependent methyltransferase [Actinomycetota bacterium]